MTWWQRLNVFLLASALAAGTVFYTWPWLGYYSVPFPNLFAAWERTSPAWVKALPKIEESRRRAQEALRKRLAAIPAFFRSRESAGARGFAREVLSLKGKWVLVKSTLGIDNEHARFLAAQFNRHLFTPDDLRALLEAVVNGYLADLDAIDNELLLRLRADLADTDLARGPLAQRLRSDETFRQEIRRIAGDLAPSLGIDVGVLAGRTLATTVGPANVLAEAAAGLVTRLAGALAAEAGISTTFYGAGAVSGAATLGTSIAVMVVLDKVIEQILLACGYDAEEKLTGEIHKALRGTEELILGGTKDALETYNRIRNMADSDGLWEVRAACRKAIPLLERGGHLGLNWELQHLTEVRAQLLRAALRKLLVEGEQR